MADLVMRVNNFRMHPLVPLISRWRATAAAAPLWSAVMLAGLLAWVPVFGAGGKGRTFYVSPAGDDAAPGSETFPWRTIQKACDEMKPGDTTIVRAGIYNEQLFFEVEGNAEEGPVTLQAEGRAVITALGLDEDNVIYIEDKSWIRIIGFEIRDLHTEDGSGIRFEGSGTHLEFRDNHIHSIRGRNAMGITIYGTDPDEPVSGVIIDGNEIHDCDAAPSEALTLNGNVTDFEVTNNHVRDIVGVGIDFIGGEEGMVDDRTKVARNGLCRGNVVERVRANYGGGYGPGIYVDGGRDILVEGNRVSECDLGIEVGAENPGVMVTGVAVVGNVISGNDKAGLAVGGYEKKRGRVKGCRFENNLIRDNTGHAKPEAEVWIQWAGENLFRNNLVVGRPGAKAPLLSSEHPDQDNRLDFNLWHQPGGEPVFVWSGREHAGFEAFREASGQEKMGRGGDPKWAADGVHLEAGSPAIDAGDPETAPGAEAKDLDGEPRVKGGRVDIGPDER